MFRQLPQDWKMNVMILVYRGDFPTSEARSVTIPWVLLAVKWKRQLLYDGIKKLNGHKPENP